MNNVEQLGNFLNRVTSDINLTSTHISVCAALCSEWVTNGFNNPFNISRNRLMSAARIKSKTTYHKIIRELARFKYLNYNPSYNPGKCSKVFILLDYRTALPPSCS